MKGLKLAGIGIDLRNERSHGCFEWLGLLDRLFTKKVGYHGINEGIITSCRSFSIKNSAVGSWTLGLITYVYCQAKSSVLE